MDKKHALIIGAGPAGLTAAYELLTKTNIKPIIIESTNDIGGISKHLIIKIIKWIWVDIDSFQSQML